MNKNELIAAIAEETGVMRSEVTRVLNAFTDTVATAVAAGEEVAIPGIGKIKTVARAARTLAAHTEDEHNDAARSHVRRSYSCPADILQPEARGRSRKANAQPDAGSDSCRNAAEGRPRDSPRIAG